MTEELIKENDLIFLILDDRRRWLIQVKKDKNFHTHKGTIDFEDIIGKPFGSVVFSKPYDSQGYKFYVLKPLPADYSIHMARKTQIIYPEDAGLIIIYTGIGSGDIIIEAGCGSGALSCILGNIVKPNGHVYSYDNSEKSLKRAKKNIERAQLQNVISVQYGDISKEIYDHRDVDAVVLDLPAPWEAIEIVKHYLKLSRILVSFSPTIEQVKKTTFALKKNNFFEINTFELIKRKIQVRENATRPEVRMIGHTGYITFGRKIKDIPNPYRERKPKTNEFINLNGMPLRD